MLYLFCLNCILNVELNFMLFYFFKAPRTSDHQSRLQQAEMFYGYDSLYYGGNGGGGSYDQQVNYAKFNKPAYQRRNRAQYKSEYDLLVNGVQGG